MCDCLSHSPHRGPGPQPRHVPWLGMEPATLWFTGQHSVHWATPARVRTLLLERDRSGFESYLYHFLAMWPWASYLRYIHFPHPKMDIKNFFSKALWWGLNKTSYVKCLARCLDPNQCFINGGCKYYLWPRSNDQSHQGSQLPLQERGYRWNQVMAQPFLSPL